MLLHELYDEEILEGPKWDAFKKQAAGAAVGAGLVGAAVTGLGNKPVEKPASIPAAITQPAAQDAPNAFVKDEPKTQPKVDVAASQYGSTSMHVSKEGQSKFLAYAQKQGIKGVELAALMAQAAHETGGFYKLAETGSKEYFSQYDGKLGNNKPGDGYRYRGRAYLHITGKWMYNHVGKGIGVDLVKHPELLEKPEIAAKASIWYWNNIVKPNVKDFNDVIAVTAKVQGGAGGLGDRATNFDDYKRKLKV